MAGFNAIAKQCARSRTSRALPAHTTVQKSVGVSEHCRPHPSAASSPVITRPIMTCSVVGRCEAIGTCSPHVSTFRVLINDRWSFCHVIRPGPEDPGTCTWVTPTHTPLHTALIDFQLHVVRHLPWMLVSKSVEHHQAEPLKSSRTNQNSLLARTPS